MQRGVLPTYVSDDEVVLCKSAPAIRDAYEIRLALFMSLERGSRFILAVMPDAEVDSALESHLAKWGGRVVRAPITEYSVYVGGVDSEGNELDGWVAGDRESWNEVLSSLKSGWLRERLCVGSVLPCVELDEFRRRVGSESIPGRNIDDEDLQEALVRLALSVSRSAGRVFIQ